jgi:nickel/cobalt exporter
MFMSEGLTGVLVAAAIAVGSLHTLAPDHWVPFAALARACRWTTGRLVATTAICGLGHVTVSVLLGLLALFFGVEMLQLLGRRMESVASVLLIAFGLTYALLGLRRAFGRRLANVHDHGRIAHHHPHVHAVRHDHSDARRGSMTAWTLFLLFCADPCIAVVPILFAAAPLGVLHTAVVVGAYEIATIATMVALVMAAGLATSRVRGRWLDLYGDAAAGAVIAAVGVAVTVIGW